MKDYSIKINEVEDVKNLVKALSKINGDFDIVDSHYVIDAKSILGVMSLDLSKTLKFRIVKCDNIDEVESVIKDYIVD